MIPNLDKLNLGSLILAFVFQSSIAFSAPRYSLPNPTWPKIEAILSNNPNLKSVDDFVEKLPSELRSNYALMYRSRGLAKDVTHFENPRVILFGAGDIFLSYNSCEKSTLEVNPFCESIEVIYEKSFGKLAAKVIHFPGKPSPSLSKFFVTAPDAIRDCKGCHGSGFRPLFEPHDSWVGTYGSLSNQNHDVMAENSPEHIGYTNFIHRIFELEDGKISKPKPGFERYTQLSWKNSTPVAADSQQTLAVLHGRSLRPNALLNTEANRVNLRRILRDFVDHKNGLRNKDFSQFQYAIQWWGKCMGDMAPIFTYYWGRWFKQPAFEKVFPNLYFQGLAPYEQMLTTMSEAIKTGYRAHLDEIFKDNSISPGTSILSENPIIYYNSYVPTLVRLMELMGLPTEGLSTSFEMQPFNHASLERGVEELPGIINSFFSETAPEVSQLSCAELEKRSIAALE